MGIVRDTVAILQLLSKFTKLPRVVSGQLADYATYIA